MSGTWLNKVHVPLLTGLSASCGTVEAPGTHSNLARCLQKAMEARSRVPPWTHDI